MDKKDKWSAEVTKNSHALDLEKGVFTWKDPAKIAQAIAHSALASKEHKVSPLQSAMSMLDFYINRAGKNLSDEQKQILEKAKPELRVFFDNHKDVS